MGEEFWVIGGLFLKVLFFFIEKKNENSSRKLCPANPLPHPTFPTGSRHLGDVGFRFSSVLRVSWRVV
jgi:hypothetical protein